MAEDIQTTVQFQADITDFKGAMQEANRSIKLANSEFKAASSGMDDWSDSTDGLTAKLKQLTTLHDAQRRKLDVLNAAYEKAAREQGEASDAAVELKTKINNQQAVVNATAKDIKKYEDALEETESGTKGLSKATDKAEGSLAALGKVGGVVVGAMAAVGAAVAAAVAAFIASAEATRDYRRELAQLAQNATDAGHQMDTVKKTLADVAAVTGETDAAMEGLNMLMATGLDTKNLEMAADAFAGAATKFDGLKFEGMAEGLQESLAVGSAVGPFAELIERTGTNLETFNKGMEACTTEAERQQYAMDWLAKSGLKEIHDAYVQTNADLVEADKAQFNLNDKMAQLGAIAEPITTAFKNIGTAILSDALPGIQALADGFMGVLNGEKGAAANLGTAVTDMVTGFIQKATEALPMVLEIGASLIKSVAVGIFNSLPMVLETGREIITNLVTGISENLPSLVDRGLDALMNFATTIYDGAPSLINTGFELLGKLVQGIMDSLPTLIAKAPEIISKFANTINDNFPTILAKGVQLVWQIIQGIIKAIPTLIANIPKIIAAIVDVWSAFNWLNLGKNAIKWLGDGFKNMLGFIKNMGQNVVDSATSIIKNLPQTLLNLGKNAVSGLGNALKGGLSAVKSAASSIVSNITSVLSGLPSKMLSIGGDIVRGIWDGIKNAGAWLWDQLSNFAGGIVNSIAGALGINSPSTVARDFIGKNFDLGIAEGVDRNKDKVMSAVRGLGESMTGGLPSGASGAAPGAAAGGKSISFTQIINSPRALSRREIYRQTHNALAYAGGVS